MNHLPVDARKDTQTVVHLAGMVSTMMLMVCMLRLLVDVVVVDTMMSHSCCLFSMCMRKVISDRPEAVLVGLVPQLVAVAIGADITGNNDQVPLV